MKNKPWTKEKFILESRKVHGNKYDYSNINYINNDTRVIIECKIHGKFNQLPHHHLQKRGCLKCSIDKKTSNKKEFVKKSKEIHGNKYDYSKVNYINAKTKIEIICKKHGSFFQTPDNHLHGKGCKKCSKKYKPTKNEFVYKVNKIHNYRYDYSKVNYINNHSNIKIICPIHGIFNQISGHHLRGSGCPKCIKRISKPEIKFLKYLKLPKKYRQYKIGRKNVDGYDPETNTIYEFLGDYWHGNPNKYKYNKNHPVFNKPYKTICKETFNRLNKLKSMGYNVKYIWESDWNKFKNGPDKILTIQEI